MTVKTNNSIDNVANMQHYAYDPEEVTVEAVPYLQQENDGFDGSYATNLPVAATATASIEECYAPQESYVSPTAPAPYAVTSQQYQQQVAAIRRRNCLIGGSISITVAIICCLCFFLPVMIFFIAWSQMNKSVGSYSYMHPH